MPAKKKVTKRNKLQEVAEFLDRAGWFDNEPIGVITANHLREIIGRARTDEEVAVLNRLEQGTPAGEIRELLP